MAAYEHGRCVDRGQPSSNILSSSIIGRVFQMTNEPTNLKIDHMEVS